MSSITLEELQAFHNIDCEAYARLVFELGFDCDTSKKIVALWYWLETVGYRNFIHNSLTLATTTSQLDELANESALCLNCLYRAIFSHARRDDHLQVMSEVGGKTLSLEFVYEKRASARIRITKFVRDVCDIIFTDIVPPNNLYNQVQLLAHSVEFLQSQVNIHRREHNGNHSQMMANLQATEETDRTLFVTFSRGHPIPREQLQEFLTRRFGEDFVENILMEDDGESLFACVIVRSLSHVTDILGQNKLVQFNIHGRDVRMRRFIPKQAPVA